MAANAPATVVLTFGDAAAEVLLPEEGLPGLAAEAEARFCLHPKSYGVYDAHGRLESTAALQRAVRMAVCEGNGTRCTLEVRENPEWQRMRQLEAQIQQLALSSGSSASVAAPAPVLAAAAEAAEVAVRQAMAAVEERVMAKVDAALAEMRIDLHQADQKANAVAVITSLVKHLTIEHIDMKASLQSRQECSSNPGVRVDLETAQKVQRLEEDIRSMRDQSHLAQHGFKALQAEVRQLSERCQQATGEIRCADWTVPFLPSPPKAAHSALDTAGMQMLSYSRKSNPVSNIKELAANNSAPAPPSPFARGLNGNAWGATMTAPPLFNHREQRLSGCRSLPHLPAVH